MERVRFHFYLIMAFRRLEAVHVQSLFGSIDPHRTQGFERSLISILASGGGKEWWEGAKVAFSEEFADFIDEKRSAGGLLPVHPGFSPRESQP